MAQCQYVTSNGDRCQKRALLGCFCWSHKSEILKRIIINGAICALMFLGLMAADLNLHPLDWIGDRLDQLLTFTISITTTNDTFADIMIQGYDAYEQEHYRLALAYYQSALTLARESANQMDEVTALLNTATVYEMQDKLDEALESYEQILTIVREVYPPTTEGRILTAIGITYQHQGQYRRAFEAYDQALAIARQEGDRVGEAIALNSVAGAFSGSGEYTDAMENYQQALAIAREENYQEGEMIALSGIGYVYCAQYHYEQAREAYQQALAIADTIECEDLWPQGLTNSISALDRELSD